MTDHLAEMLLAPKPTQFSVDIRKPRVQLCPLLLQCVTVFAFQQLFRLPVSGIFFLKSGGILKIQARHVGKILDCGDRFVQGLASLLLAVQDDSGLGQLFDPT